MDKVYLQIFSYGFESKMTMEEKLKTTAEMGYSGVEFAGGYDGLTAGQMKELLEKYHLEAVSSHVDMDSIDESLQYMSELGAKMIVVPGYPFSNKEEALECAKLLNKHGERAAKYGIKIGYHNHTGEFYPCEGKPLLDYVIENTDPRYVGFQLDCGWASAAGIDVVKYIGQHAGRFMSIHVKENNAVVGSEKPHGPNDPMPPMELDENGKPVVTEEMLKMFEESGKANVATGKGIVNWKLVKRAADAQGCMAYIVEREWSYNTPKDRIKCLKEDLEYLKNYV